MSKIAKDLILGDKPYSRVYPREEDTREAILRFYGVHGNDIVKKQLEAAWNGEGSSRSAPLSKFVVQHMSARRGAYLRQLREEFLTHLGVSWRPNQKDATSLEAWQVEKENWLNDGNL